jgi:hypothetical protein
MKRPVPKAKKKEKGNVSQGFFFFKDRHVGLTYQRLTFFFNLFPLIVFNELAFFK